MKKMAELVAGWADPAVSAADNYHADRSGGLIEIICSNGQYRVKLDIRFLHPGAGIF
jgi:hypothetical protein